MLMKNVSPMSEMMSSWKLLRLNSPSSLLRTFKSLFGCISVFPRASQVAIVEKNPSANARDVRDAGLIPGLGRSPGGGHENPLRILAWRISMKRGAWWATVHGVAKSRTQLSNFNFLLLSTPHCKLHPCITTSFLFIAKQHYTL